MQNIHVESDLYNGSYDPLWKQRPQILAQTPTVAGPQIPIWFTATAQFQRGLSTAL